MLKHVLLARGLPLALHTDKTADEIIILRSEKLQTGSRPGLSVHFSCTLNFATFKVSKTSNQVLLLCSWRWIDLACSFYFLWFLGWWKDAVKKKKKSLSKKFCFGWLRSISNFFFTYNTSQKLKVNTPCNYIYFIFLFIYIILLWNNT